MAGVKLDNVYKIYDGNVTAVEDFNLEILDGEFLVLVGPSGCGKSTTLRMIAGLEEITKGSIRIADRVVNDVPPKDRDIAMVFQNYALYPHMTVYENMAFGLKLRRFRRDEIDRRVKNAAEILGLTEYLQRRPKALSGGQRQRVAVGRAIVRQPAAFLFDEPLSNLDAKMRVQMRVEISLLHSKLGTTMIYVTHDQVEAMTMGDRIVVMKDGVIQQAADPITLYDKPANRFVAGFIGTPPMNFFEGRITRNSSMVFEGDGFSVNIPEKHHSLLEAHVGKSATLGIRPEDITTARGTADPDTGKLLARVEVVEPMGSETYWHLAVGINGFIARVDSHVNANVGDEVAVRLNLDKAHYFDTRTDEKVISKP